MVAPGHVVGSLAHAGPLPCPPHYCAAFWLRRARSKDSTSVSFSARAELSSILTNSSRDGAVPAAASPPASPPLLAGCGGGVCMSVCMRASCWRIASISSSTLLTRAASSCALARADSSSALSALPYSLNSGRWKRRRGRRDGGGGGGGGGAGS